MLILCYRFYIFYSYLDRLSSFYQQYRSESGDSSEPTDTIKQESTENEAETTIKNENENEENNNTDNNNNNNISEDTQKDIKGEGEEEESSASGGPYSAWVTVEKGQEVLDRGEIDEDEENNNNINSTSNNSNINANEFEEAGSETEPLKEKKAFDRDDSDEEEDGKKVTFLKRKKGKVQQKRNMRKKVAE